MANYFVDSTTGSDSDNGTTMDLAWATIEHAVEAGSLSDNDIVWVRRVHAEYSTDPTSHIQPQYNPSTGSFIGLVGWPRAEETSISSATWTNGSTTVDLIVGLSMDREKHLGRYITCPAGETYIIAKVVDSNTILIEREYAGSTVSGTDGACTINADEDYDTAQAIDDSGWTINKATWNADADDLPVIDFRNTGYGYYTQKYRQYIANIEFRDSTYAYGSFLWGGNCCEGKMVGCLFHNDNNDVCMSVSGGPAPIIERCVFTGNPAAGSANHGLYILTSAALFRDCIVYDVGGHGFSLSGGAAMVLENVNIGIEGTIGGYDIYSSGRQTIVLGRCVKFGASSGEFRMTYGDWSSYVNIENFNKVLGAHKIINNSGEVIRNDVVAGSGDPYKRDGGADSVVEVVYDKSAAGWSVKDCPWEQKPIFVHEFEATTDSKSYRYYVQAEGAVANDELWLEAEYVSAHDDTSEYVIKRVTSDEAISARSGADDWGNYIEVTEIQPAVASKVRIKCHCTYYHATNKIYIDPKVVIS